MPFALLAPGTAHTQPSEAAVKAAFLVKFAAYVVWPSADGPIALCLVGRDVFDNALDHAAAGQQIDGRSVTVRRIESVDSTSGCDIAYLAGSSHQPISEALAALHAAPVLTVTDSRWSNARGMIHFQMVQRRVRFYIDDKAAAESKLGISSKLLALALSVKARAQ